MEDGNTIMFSSSLYHFFAHHFSSGKPLRKKGISKNKNVDSYKKATMETNKIELGQYEIIKILSSISEKINKLEENMNNKFEKLNEEVQELNKKIELKNNEEKNNQNNNGTIKNLPIQNLIQHQFLNEDLNNSNEDYLDSPKNYIPSSRGTSAVIMRDSTHDELEFLKKNSKSESNKSGIFSNLKLSSLPLELPKTHKLYLDFNKLEQISKVDFVKMRTQCGNLTTLILNNNLLKDVAKEIQLMMKLTTLFLQNNKLTELPSTIGKLKHLKILNIANNQITELPDSISELSSLEKFGSLQKQIYIIYLFGIQKRF